MSWNALAVIGPTAAGKTALAVRLAGKFSGEVISADSRQVYCGLDIGSGKDISEYGNVPYHLIDIARLPDEYTVFHYVRDFKTVFADISRRGVLPVLCGGTGLYLDAVIRGYRLEEVPVNPALRAELEGQPMQSLQQRLLEIKPDLHNRTDLEDRDRLIRAIELAEYRRGKPEPVQEDNPFKPLIFGVRFDRTELRERIRIRLLQRLDSGLVEEVAFLHESGITWERLESLGLEYRFTAEYLQGKTDSKDQYVEKLYTAICQFAKRQDTWFRGMERKGVSIHWLDRGELPPVLRQATTNADFSSISVI